jgi:hypothetical protein
MSASKAKGTRFETAVCDYLNAEGFAVERRALAGAADKGDVAGLPVAVEVKNVKATALAAWVDEADAEGVNAKAPLGGVVWHHRRGRAHPSQGFVTMSGATFVRLLRAITNGESR